MMNVNAWVLKPKPKKIRQMLWQDKDSDGNSNEDESFIDDEKDKCEVGGGCSKEPPMKVLLLAKVNVDD